MAGGHVVVPPVEMSEESQDFGPAREGAGKPPRHQRCLGAGRGESDALSRRHKPPNNRGPANLHRMIGAEMCALSERILHRGKHAWMVMAEKQRTMSAE